jgi:hypothetical protein
MLIPGTSWTPTPSDIAWQENMIRILKDGAVWGVPISESAFLIDKSAKTFQLISGDPWNETNRRIAKVFALLDYTEVDASTPKPKEEDK